MNHLLGRLAPCFALVLTLVVAAGCGHHAGPTTPSPTVTLAQAVEQARLRHGLPAIAAASFTLDSVEVAVSGVRRLGVATPATAADLFHVGSLAKGMTATAIGALVDDGLLSWSLTLAEAFPEFAATMDTAYRAVTLAELLQNRSGAPGFNDLEEFAAVPPFPGDVTAQRHAFVGWLLAQPPAVARGTYLYSTAGFSVAAAIAEARSGQHWDDLLRARVLTALGTNLFIGWPLEAGPDEPCGHMPVGGVLQPVEPSAGHIPGVLAPGGDVSMTVRGYADYARLHLQALCGRPGVLAPATWAALHAPVGDYAMGWSVIEADGNVALTHTGSPATFYAFVVLYRNQRHGFVVIMNADTPEVDGAILDILTAMAPSVSAATTRAAIANTRPLGSGRAR